MENMMAHVLLRVFSGVHVGAEVALPAGSFVIGSSDSCDIIFAESGLGARHLEVTVPEASLRNKTELDSAEEPSFAQVSFIPLDGVVYSKDQLLPAGLLPGPGIPLSIGTICVAFARPDCAEADWKAVREALHTATSSDPENWEPEEKEPALTLVADESNNVGNFEENSQEERLSTPVRRLYKKIIVGIAVVTACFVIVYVPLEGMHDPTASLRQSLADAGYGQLEIRRENGNVTVKGVLRTDAERAKVHSLARNVQYPVHLELTIWQDRKNAIEAAFAGRGFTLAVTDDPDGKSLLLAGYMYDRLVEEWAFSSVKDDMPNFESGSAGLVRRKVRHANEVAAVLEPALAAAGLGKVFVSYQPAVVNLQAVLDGEEKAKLASVLAATSKKLGVPIPAKLSAGQPAAPAAVAQQARPAHQDMAQALPQATTDSELQVVEIAMSPLPFVRLATGERIFEGGLMPGKFTLVRISLHELVLMKEGHETIYRLRGEQ